MLNVPITPPRVAFIDPRTGNVSREWYMFFLSLYTLVGGSDLSLDDLQKGTPPVTVDELYSAINAATANLRPSTESEVEQIAELRKQIEALEIQVRPELGTMAALQQDNVPWITYDNTPESVPALTTGTVFWDNADRAKTLAVVMEDSGEIIQDIGQETFYRVKATSAITKGQVVMFTGTVGASGGLTGAPATGLGPTDNERIMGIATQDIALNGWGYVTWFGEVGRFNTTGGAESWVNGDVLYYNPAVAGGLTKNIPVAPNPKVIMAAVVYAANNGILFVRPTFGSALGATDSNVEITSLTNGDTLVYDSADQRWENRAQSSLVVGRADNLSGGLAGSVPYQTAVNTTTMLGIGVSGHWLGSSGTAPQWNAPAALTKTDDTNVTLTLGGSATTALLNAASLTLGWTGTLSTTRGGTGFSSYAIGDITFADTATSLNKLSIGAANTVLTSSGAAPQWSTGLALTSASSIEVTDNANAALRITQLGTGTAFVVEDETSPDSTAFVIDSEGRVAIGGSNLSATSFIVRKIQEAASPVALRVSPAISAGVTANPRMFQSRPSITGATLNDFAHFNVEPDTVTDSTISRQFGYAVQSSLTAATQNFGFYGNVGSAADRWNFYAAGTAPNYFAGDVRTNTVVTQATSPTNSNTSATATASSLLGGIRTGTPTANINLTLPTGANMDAAFTSLQTNQAFEWSYINLAAATHVVTILGNTAHTLVGAMTVQPATSARFKTRKTAADTFVTYRIN